MHGIKVLIIITIIGITLLYIQRRNEEVCIVRSTVDGREYVVRNLPDKQRAADILATVRQKMRILVNYLETKYASDDRVKTISQRYNEDRISEGGHTSGYTTYTVNKGDEIVFCLRDRDGTDSLHTDVNLLLYVTIHELAHICTPEINHTDMFKRNNLWLVEKAMECGVYQYIDFSKTPKRYCGMYLNQ